MSERNYEQKYNDIMAHLMGMHKHNIQKMRVTLRSLLIIPTIFLILVFMTDSNKTVFLVLWIASMFIIAAMLIVNEYQDYTIRKIIQSVEAPEELEEAVEVEVPEEVEATEEVEAPEEIEEAPEEVEAPEEPEAPEEVEAPEEIEIPEEVEAPEEIEEAPAFNYDTPDESAAQEEVKEGADS